MMLIFYFLYHAINGERGIISYWALSRQLSKYQAELDAIRSERLHFEHRVNLMRSESLDLDLLEEQSRKILGYAKSSEKIFSLPVN
jgi:cell division protein FtsB